MRKLAVPAKKFDVAILNARLTLGVDSGFGHTAWLYEHTCKALLREEKWIVARKIAAILAAVAGPSTTILSLMSANWIVAQTGSATRIVVAMRLTGVIFLAAAVVFIASCLMIRRAGDDRVGFPHIITYHRF